MERQAIPRLLPLKARQITAPAAFISHCFVVALLVATLALPPSSATAQLSVLERRLASTPERRLASSGSWSALTRPISLVLDRSGVVSVVDSPICVAQTGSEESAIFRVVFFGGDILIVHVWSRQWSFRHENAVVTLRSATGQSGSVGAVGYGDEYIEMFLEPPGATRFLDLMTRIAQEGGPHFEVLDRRDRVLVRFPTNGMREMLERARRCAQSYP
jgi:hypothetical protein